MAAVCAVLGDRRSFGSGLSLRDDDLAGFVHHHPEPPLFRERPFIEGTKSGKRWRVQYRPPLFRERPFIEGELRIRGM